MFVAHRHAHFDFFNSLLGRWPKRHKSRRTRSVPTSTWPGFLAWLGMAPFFVFAIMFLILPTGYLVVGAFQDASGHPTLVNIAQLFQPTIVSAYWVSVR